MDTNRHNDTDILESALDELRHEGESLGPSPQALTRTREALASAGRKTPGLHLAERIRHMKNWKYFKKTLVTAAAAAVVIAAVSVWMHMPNGSVPSFTGITFADVQQKMQNMETFRCLWSIPYPPNFKEQKTSRIMTEQGEVIVEAPVKKGREGDVFTAEVFLKNPGFGRMEMIDNPRVPDFVGSYTIADSKGFTMFFPKQKIYREKSYSSPPRVEPDYMFSMVEKMIQSCRNKIEAGEVKSLGEKIIDGRKAKGFKIPGNPPAGGEIWADAETAMPIEITSYIGEKKMTISHIRMNEPMDDSLFSRNIPEGYRNFKEVNN